ncbi:MAG: damage-inducible protein DinB, partial [Sphingobacteriales bacterium 24-40-4]
MNLIKNFLKELESEAQITKKMLSRIPDDKFGWKP